MDNNSRFLAVQEEAIGLVRKFLLSIDDDNIVFIDDEKGNVKKVIDLFLMPVSLRAYCIRSEIRLKDYRSLLLYRWFSRSQGENMAHYVKEFLEIKEVPNYKVKKEITRNFFATALRIGLAECKESISVKSINTHA